MNCPPALSTALLDILANGLLRARAAGWSGDAERAAFEADHVHNLPALLQHFSPEALQYYWDSERLAYATRLDLADRAMWEPLWDALHEVAEVNGKVLT